MRRSVRAAAVVGIGGLVVWKVARRRKHPGPPVARAALVVAAASPRFDWDPLSWIDDATKIAGKVVKDVVDWVETIGKWLGNLIVKLINDAYNWAAGEFDQVWNQVTAIWNAIAEVTGDGIHAIYHLVSSLEHAMLGWAKDVWHEVWKLVGSGWRDLLSFWREIIHYLDVAIEWWWHKVIDPAIHDVLHGLKDIGKGFEAFWDIVYRDVIKPIEHDAEEAYDDVRRLWEWVDKDAADAVHLVEKAWDWLELFALNPPQAIFDIEQDIIKGITLPAVVADVGPAYKYIFDQISAALPELYGEAAAQP